MGDTTNIEDVTPSVDGAGGELPDPLSYVRDLVVVTRMDETIVYASPASTSVLGVQPDRLVGTPTAQWIHPADVDDVRASRSAAIHSDVPYTVEMRLRHDEHGWIWCESRVAITRHDDGTAQFIVSSVRDIGPRRRAQELVSMLHRVATACNAATSEHDTFEQALTAVCQTLGWPSGHALVAEGDKLLHGTSCVADPDDVDLQHWVGSSGPDQEARVLAETAGRTGRVTWTGDTHRSSMYGSTTGRSGAVDGVAVPVHAGGELAAVLVWCPGKGRGVRTLELQDALECLGDRVATTIGRLRSHERLREAVSDLAKFETVFSRLHDVVLFVDPRTLGIVYANDQAARLARTPLQHLVGSYPWQTWTDLGQESLRATQAAMPNGQDTVEFDTEVVGPDGAGLTVAFVAQQVDDVLVLVGHDVTARREAEAVRARLAALVEHADVAVAVIDRDRRISTWNAAAQQMFGYADHEVDGLDWRCLFPVNRHDQIERITEEVRQGQPIRQETLARRKDAYPFEISASMAPIRDLQGPPYPISLIAADITEQRQALRLLEASEERFRRLAENASEGIYQLSLEPYRRFEYVNPAVEEITGIDAGRWYRSAGLITDHLHPDDAALLIDARSEGSDTRWPIEVRWHRPEGEYVWLEIREHVLDPSGDTDTVQGLMLDVTARHAHEQALREAIERERVAADELRRLDGLKTAFLQSISHELRTPLTSVVGFAQTLREHEERLPAPERRRLLERMASNAHRLSGLLGDLLDLDRLSRRVIEPQCKVFDLSALCRAVAEQLDPAGRQLHLPDDPMIVTADPALIERILDNLLRNSLRHASAGTMIAVITQRTETTVELVVEDDGPGLPDENLDLLFEPFHHGRRAREAASPGLGIGLSLVRRFARLHGGDAHAERRPSGGARFVITLPTQPAGSRATRQLTDAEQDDATSSSDHAPDSNGPAVIPAMAWHRLAQLVERRLSELDVTRDELAGRAGLSRRTIDRLLNGDPEPLRMRSVRNIARELNVPFAEVIAVLAAPESGD